MAKARKATAFSATERFLGFHHCFPAVADDLPDLAEWDIWYSPPATTVDQEAQEGTNMRVGGRRQVEPEPWEQDQKEEEDGEGWVLRRQARASASASASVVEGVGRTLKGRDALRVRDAVWSLTGFPG